MCVSNCTFLDAVQVSYRASRMLCGYYKHKHAHAHTYTHIHTHLYLISCASLGQCVNFFPYLCVCVSVRACVHVCICAIVGLRNGTRGELRVHSLLLMFLRSSVVTDSGLRGPLQTQPHPLPSWNGHMAEHSGGPLFYLLGRPGGGGGAVPVPVGSSNIKQPFRSHQGNTHWLCFRLEEPPPPPPV